MYVSMSLKMRLIPVAIWWDCFRIEIIVLCPVHVLNYYHCYYYCVSSNSWWALLGWALLSHFKALGMRQRTVRPRLASHCFSSIGQMELGLCLPDFKWSGQRADSVCVPWKEEFFFFFKDNLCVWGKVYKKVYGEKISPLSISWSPSMDGFWASFRSRFMCVQS